MPSVFSRVFLIYNLFLYLVPKKLRAFLPTSWYQNPIHAKTDPSPPPPPPPPPRRMDSDELRLVFQMFDRNGDERITKKELNDSLESMGIFIPSHELSQMIDKIDLNGDGCIDMDEFKALYRSFMDERGVEDEFMREAFDVFDQNGDGFISPDELNFVLESLGLKQGRAAEDCEMMITRVDADGDGLVDFSEFKQMMRGNN